MNAQPKYPTKGPGDLTGDSTNPNSPDYVEPAFDESEAMWSAAKKMELDDVAEILGDLADYAAWLTRMQATPGLTPMDRSRLSTLIRHARELEAKRDAEYRLLNEAAA